MKIHLLSDLHVEFWKQDKRAKLTSLLQPADVLVLAGDIAVGRTNVLEVIKWIDHCGFYKQILYIPGNHEYYSGTKLGEFRSHDNFVGKLPVTAKLLDRDSIVLDNVLFIGATLFTNFKNGDPLAQQAARWGINDFAGSRQSGASIESYTDIYNKDIEYMKFRYEHREPGQKVVFISHFVPDISLNHPKWGGETNLMNYYFANQLGDWMATLDPCYWLFGHTHDEIDKMIGDCRCIANPLGYPGEKNFNQRIIDVL